MRPLLPSYSLSPPPSHNSANRVLEVTYSRDEGQDVAPAEASLLSFSTLAQAHTATVLPTSPPNTSTTSSDQVVAALRRTPKGRLRYERGQQWRPQPTSPTSPTTSPTSWPSSPSPPASPFNSSTRSVLEEVEREAPADLASALREMNLRERKAQYGMMEPVLEEVIVPREAYLCGGDASKKTPVQEEPVVARRAYTCGPSSAEKKTPQKENVSPAVVRPTSPVDLEIRALDMWYETEKQTNQARRLVSLSRHKSSTNNKFGKKLEEVVEGLHLAKRLQEEEDQRAAEADRLNQERLQREEREQARLRAEAAEAQMRELEARAEARRAQAKEGLKAAMAEAAAAGVMSPELDAAVAAAAMALERAEDAGRMDQLAGRLRARVMQLREEAEKRRAAAVKAEEEKRKREAKEEEEMKRKMMAQAAAEAAKAEAERLKQEQQAKEAQAAAAAALASKPEVTPLVVRPTSAAAAELLLEASPGNAERAREAAAVKAGMAARIQFLVDAASTDAAVKSFKNACQFAVSLPVNGISAPSSAFLRDKLDKLRDLLAGRPVNTVAAHPNFSAAFPASDPALGTDFCSYLAAGKFVAQGEEVISSKPEFAFSMAAVAAALSSEFPTFGRLFLAHLFESCPYLVPVSYQRTPNQSDEDHYKRLGYRYASDGKVEEQTKYLKRMGGLAKLYAAVCTSSLPKDRKDQDHPHGLGHLWSWLCSTVNLVPVNDVTATLIHDVLETAGHDLGMAYGPEQFGKMLKVVKEDFLGRIRGVTLEGSGGPVVRLEEFLKKVEAAGGTVKRPEAALPSGFL